ncbi:MAG TPA: DUF1289 domain-containing protein [Rhodanobacteraceae bacterium]|nr:DUF1289 domain-containing protein [Rhodanobacteraceae bacterium]
MTFFPSVPRAVLSPCIGVCELDASDHCLGCHRTRAEIARWSAMGDAERLHVMDQLLPARERERAAAAARSRAGA